MNKTKKGFTLIELLVVIAIIAILASTVIISLSSSRNKAYDSAALTTMRSVQAEGLSCVLGSGANGLPEELNAPVAGQKICASSSQNYPQLAKGQWKYSSGSSTAAMGTFALKAEANRDPSIKITCTENGCAQGETVN